MMINTMSPTIFPFFLSPADFPDFPEVLPEVLPDGFPDDFPEVFPEGFPDDFPDDFPEVFPESDLPELDFPLLLGEDPISITGYNNLIFLKLLDK